MARARYEPTPGKVMVLSPTVMASEATTKNQPPDMLIIMFHTMPGMAKGTSSFQKRCQPDSRKLVDTSTRSRAHAQRLVEAERHVPGLAGKDRKDRRELGAEHASGKQQQERTSR
jgi:hypothetical protein